MNPDAFFAAPAVIQIHAAAAATALAAGVWMLAAPKGTVPHRTVGWGFVALMGMVAVTALFIRDVNPGGFSFLHAFVPLTAVGLVSGVMAIRRKSVRRHRNAMLGLVIGALVLPGLFAFMPGRLMHVVFFG